MAARWEIGMAFEKGGGARGGAQERDALDPEIRAFIAASELDYPADAATRSITEQRRFYDAMCGRFRSPRPAGVTAADSVAPGPDGPIPIRRYRPARLKARTRIVYFHGGGYCLGGLESHDDICAELAAAAELELFAVDYRLAPEHPHPAPFDDALAATRSLRARGAPLILAGDSVGGGLAAAVSLALRGAPGPRVLGSLLIYPSLSGGAQNLPAYRENAEAPLLTAAENARIAKLHAGPDDAARLAAEDFRFAPLAAREVGGAPPSIALAVDRDPLRDDAVAWADKLSAAGVQASARVFAGLPHGCLRARRRSEKAKAFFAEIVHSLLRIRNI